MATLPEPQDPTLDAADRALEAKENAAKPRGYLGMSGIGHSCERSLWYGWRWCSVVRHNAATLKRFADGNHGEDVQAARLRLVDGVTLITLDPDTGRQIALGDDSGHLKGHMDGAILGLIQAPQTWHVFEHKQVDEKKQAKLAKLKAELGEKNALAAWDETYHAQAVLYMHFSGMTRHYLTCSTPGGRSTISVRTEEDPALALRLLAKAARIIAADKPPARISDDSSYYLCRWCPHSGICHSDEWAPRHCRSCLHSAPVENGQWQCALQNKSLSLREQQAGCLLHLFNPKLVPSREQIDATDRTVTYLMKDGSEWVDGADYA